MYFLKRKNKQEKNDFVIISIIFYKKNTLFLIFLYMCLSYITFLFL
jgi:hypothetical protein